MGAATYVALITLMRGTRTWDVRVRAARARSAVVQLHLHGLRDLSAVGHGNGSQYWLEQ